MIVNKITMRITVEVFSVRSVNSLLIKVMDSINEEMYIGELHAEDGDTVKWVTEQEEKEL